VIFSTDYICDKADMAIIRSVADSNEKRTVVLIDNQPIKFYSFKCLLNPSAQIDGEVSRQYQIFKIHVLHMYLSKILFISMQIVDTYIALIKSKGHLLVRNGMTVRIVSTTDYSYMYSNGFYKENEPTISVDRIVEWVSDYIQHDMVRHIHCQGSNVLQCF